MPSSHVPDCMVFACCPVPCDASTQQDAGWGRRGRSGPDCWAMTSGVPRRMRSVTARLSSTALVRSTLRSLSTSRAHIHSCPTPGTQRTRHTRMQAIPGSENNNPRPTKNRARTTTRARVDESRGQNVTVIYLWIHWRTALAQPSPPPLFQ